MGNVEFGLRMRGTPRAEIGGRVRRMLDLVGLPGVVARLPGQLSVGPAQVDRLRREQRPARSELTCGVRRQHPGRGVDRPDPDALIDNPLVPFGGR